MVLPPAPHRHEFDKTIHATFLYTTARLHPFSMQLPAVQEGQAKPEAVLLRQQHGCWERTRPAPRSHPDGGDAHRAMPPDHARYPPKGRAARLRWPCRQRRSGHHHLRRYPPQACRRCADHHSPERGRNPASTMTYTCGGFACKNRRPIDEISPKKQNKKQPNTELTEMGVFSAVAGNQLPNQLQKRVLPALFQLRCPSQSHQRSARGRTRLTTVTSISCRSFWRQLLYLHVG